VFGLSRSLAEAEQLWPVVQGQRLSDGERSRRSIFQQPAYLASVFSHDAALASESVDRADVTNQATGTPVEGRFTTHGFDLSGMDILTAGTLAKNISFLLVPAAGNDAVFAFESANVRFSNLLKSGWLTSR